MARKFTATEADADPLVLVCVTHRDPDTGRPDWSREVLVERSELTLFRHMRTAEWQASVLPLSQLAGK